MPTLSHMPPTYLPRALVRLSLAGVLALGAACASPPGGSTSESATARTPGFGAGLHAGRVAGR